MARGPYPRAAVHLAILALFCTLAAVLVLDRKRGQVVRIGDDITLEVLALNPDRVRLGFSAPGSVRIDRLEVWLDRQQAATTANLAADP